ncbi:protein disulfide oxidoreductase [Proteus myxofaciens]|uniref:ScsD family copper-sensitivity suppressor n=1 Tax=Proteus myxofaciens ATCC 19692 TaxID=1354337 RepID=A0A198FHU9_9GAMM|nr:protein disulfide oxidoreductase [Proteus myxofaciens]OAT24345.1 ScsD family copper-sensitivity suppressor [Proteus myxofaciens ATCC 19692]
MLKRLRKWSKELIVLIAIFVIASFAMDRWRQPTPPVLTQLPALYTVEDKPVSLIALSQEKPLLVYFWATWCGICKTTTPAVNTLAQDGYNVTTIAIRSGDDAKLLRGINAKQWGFPVINDNNGMVSQQWGISATPSFVILYKGEMVSFTSGWTSSWGLKLRLWWASF